MDRVKVTPANGKKVRDPMTKKQIPESGIVVNRSTYWIRREVEGSVILTDPAKKRRRTRQADPEPEAEQAQEPQEETSPEEPQQ